MSEDLLNLIAVKVLEGMSGEVKALCETAVRDGLDPQTIISQGLAPGVRKAGELYDRCEYFLPELLLSADALHTGIGFLLPSLKSSPGFGDKGTVVLGVVEGDVHEIGKNLVGVMLTASGFRVVDLGCNVPAVEFLAAVQAEGAAVLALSTMMTTTLPAMRSTVQQALALEPQPRIIVGGAPLSERLAHDMGAAGYALNASLAPTLL